MILKSKTVLDVPFSEITPPRAYRDRRDFLKAMGLTGAGLLTANLLPSGAEAARLAFKKSDLSTHGETLTPLKDITTYNNFYEFGTDKTDPSRNAGSLRTSPWTVTIGGLVKKPQRLDIESLKKLAPLEERVYRMRCVERWSMVIPWIGLPLSALLNAVQPLPNAKYVAFETLYDPKQMPGQQSSILDWPYKEGLRLDEAMNPLTLLAVGIYGETLPNQDGAPIRLVAPWKYGYKGVKSIVKVSLVENEPPTAWSTYSAEEYGFYSNVNPAWDHPRWSQKKERRIGEFFLRDTLMFNGYGDFVAKMYSGMDLSRYH